MGEEGRLQCLDARAGQPLDGGDAAAGDAGGGRQAGADRDAVEKHGAGAAVAGVAADLGAGETGLLAQKVGEPARRRGLERPRDTVQHQP